MRLYGNVDVDESSPPVSAARWDGGTSWCSH